MNSCKVATAPPAAPPPSKHPPLYSPSGQLTSAEDPDHYLDFREEAFLDVRVLRRGNLGRVRRERREGRERRRREREEKMG